MYVGNVDDASGLHHLLWELVSNSVDELLAGFGEIIDVTLHDDGSASVADRGRGFPIGIDDDGRSFVEKCLTHLHQTATFDGHRPHMHVARCGFGLVVVAALSEAFSIVSERDGRRWRVEASRGEIVSPLEEIDPSGNDGARVWFRPDPAVFSTTFDYESICRRLGELAALRRSVRFRARDERISHTALLEYPEGLEALLADTSGDTSPVLRFQATFPEGDLEAVCRWSERSEPTVRSYAQLKETRDNGSHVDGFLRGLVSGAHAVDDRAGPSGATREALLDGIEVILHAALFNTPRYGNPTTDRISDPELEESVFAAVSQAACEVFSSERELLAALVERARSTRR